jgi:uncharacterized protein Yka (UPF0111/DUF47 family)
MLHTVRPDVVELAKILLESSETIAEAIHLMRNFKNSPQIEERCARLHKLEYQADMILRESLVRLFNEEPNAVLVISGKKSTNALKKPRTAARRWPTSFRES